MQKIILLLICSISLYSSDTMIHGNVYGLDKEGNETELPGVQVWWKGTDLGGLSDQNGHFMFDLSPESNTLIFQMAGYPNDTLVVEDTGEFIFHTLEPFDTGKEVVVEAKEPNRIINQSSIQNEEKITGTQLGKLACCNLSEAFESDPSVHVEFSDPVSGSKQMKLMGLHGKYSQIMVEKIPFVRGLNIPFGLSYLPGPWIESISISKGAADVSTGFESTTGQINIELKKPDEINESLVNMFYDVGNRTEINSVFNRNISDKLSMINMFNANIIPNMNDMNSDGLNDRPATRNLNFSSKVKYNGDLSKAQAGVRFLIDERESEFASLGITNHFDISNSRGELFFKGGTYGKNMTMGMTGSLSWQENKTINSFGIAENEFRLRNNSAQINFMVDQGFGEMPSESDNVLSYGGSILYDDFSNEIFANSNALNNFSFFTPGIFLNFKNMSLDYLDFSLGLRADYNYLNDIFLTPRAHLRFKPFDGLDLRLSGGRGHRYANALAENVFLFLYDQNADFSRIAGFEQTAMETAWNYGATLNYLFDFGLKNISFSAEYFMTNFENRVVVDQYRYGGDYTPQIFETSSAYSESYGADLILPIFKDLELSTSARVQNSFFENTQGDLVREPLSAIIRSVNNINYDLTSLDMTLRFTATYFGSGKRTIQRAGSNSFQNFDPFWIFGGQINKEIKSLDLELYVGMQNISSYTIFSGDVDAQAISANYFGTDLWGPIMGRNIYFGIDWKGF